MQILETMVENCVNNESFIEAKNDFEHVYAKKNKL